MCSRSSRFRLIIQHLHGRKLIPGEEKKTTTHIIGLKKIVSTRDGLVHIPTNLDVVVVHLLFLTLCNPVDCSMPGPPSFTNFQSLFKFMPIESVMPSSHLIILCHPLLLLPSIFPSIRVFSSESALHIWWPQYTHIPSFLDFLPFRSRRAEWSVLICTVGSR